ncbi:MAG: cysteine desulfurase family protein [Gemmatimonadota bacterium]|jgi:cysteine desulfurase|nr:cysteine desulfurase family protein [Gemmatimonadota bacterium]MDP6528247.1 cysteine desulfurase family protein [Gemmatimonadota bacterium]MDP6802529.1 cysteine desulfurase family protein [Gemmatimonadota bacterium]MDP7031792.1 cysteine desulfurase family protein [Gemmatimonadota bacterium]
MGANPPIYLDGHSTTRVDPRVLEAMIPFMERAYGNASSRTHALGREAMEAVDRAREQAAGLIGASPREILWTSGATESDNLAVLGAVRALRSRGDGVVTCVTEHKAVLDACAVLEREGCRVTRLPVDSCGVLDLDRLADALDGRTVLVSIMAANNETGVLHPVGEIASIVHERSPALFHTDAAQAAGRVALDVEAARIDLLSLSAHKIHGPKGTGALFVRRRRPTVRLEPLTHGGGQERGMRSGTLNVPGIIGMGEALAMAAECGEAESVRIRELRDQLHERLLADLDGVHLNGHTERRLPGSLNVSFDGVDAEELLVGLPEVAVSTGAACASASIEASHVLRSMDLPEGRARSSVRFGVGRFNTREEIDRVAERVVDRVRRLRSGRGQVVGGESGGMM